MYNAREWYLRHHAVVHPHKPGKDRRVLNDAAKFQGQSLNTALLTGPELLQSLIHIFSRVIPDDKPSLGFLWREDPASENAVYQYFRHIFGSKDSPTCANYALRRTATDNKATFPEAAASCPKQLLHGRLP